jgi:hypothetical protein
MGNPTDAAVAVNFGKERFDAAYNEREAGR